MCLKFQFRYVDPAALFPGLHTQIGELRAFGTFVFGAKAAWTCSPDVPAFSVELRTAGLDVLSRTTKPEVDDVCRRSLGDGVSAEKAGGYKRAEACSLKSINWINKAELSDGSGGANLMVASPSLGADLADAAVLT